MNLKNNASGASCLNIILTVAALVLITIFITPPAGAQTAGVPEDDVPEITLEDLYMAPGVQFAAGADKKGSGLLQVQSYKIEEVRLSRPLRFDGTPEVRVVDKLLRLTVTLGSRLQGSYTIFVDDEPQTAIITQRNSVSAIFFNSAQLEDGAQISVARGGGCNTSEKSTLKTRLQLPEGRKQPQRGDADPGYRVKKIRTMRAQPGLRDRDEVEIQLTTPVPFQASNAPLVMQVGDLRVMGGGYGADPRTLIFRMSAEEFSRAEDGNRIKVKLGYCSGGGARFGKLNKSQLDQ